MPRRHKRSVRLPRVAAAILLIEAFFAAPPLAAGNIYHRYDSLGRLTRVCNALPGDGERTDYWLDSRDNRSGYANTKTDIALPPGSSISSPDGRFTLVMQADGNLVLYQNSNGQGLWGTGTNGSGANLAYFQSDGNLVVYAPSGGLWHSATYMYPCAHLDVQNDGNLVIYSADAQVVWQSGTGGH